MGENINQPSSREDIETSKGGLKTLVDLEMKAIAKLAEQISKESEPNRKNELTKQIQEKQKVLTDYRNALAKLDKALAAHEVEKPAEKLNGDTEVTVINENTVEVASNGQERIEIKLSNGKWVIGETTDGLGYKDVNTAIRDAKFMQSAIKIATETKIDDDSRDAPFHINVNGGLEIYKEFQAGITPITIPMLLPQVLIQGIDSALNNEDVNVRRDSGQLLDQSLGASPSLEKLKDYLNKIWKDNENLKISSEINELKTDTWDYDFSLIDDEFDYKIDGDVITIDSAGSEPFKIEKIKAADGTFSYKLGDLEYKNIHSAVKDAVLMQNIEAKARGKENGQFINPAATNDILFLSPDGSESADRSLFSTIDESVTCQDLVDVLNARYKGNHEKLEANERIPEYKDIQKKLIELKGEGLKISGGELIEVSNGKVTGVNVITTFNDSKPVKLIKTDNGWKFEGTDLVYEDSQYGTTLADGFKEAVRDAVLIQEIEATAKVEFAGKKPDGNPFYSNTGGGEISINAGVIYDTDFDRGYGLSRGLRNDVSTESLVKFMNNRWTEVPKPRIIEDAGVITDGEGNEVPKKPEEAPEVVAEEGKYKLEYNKKDGKLTVIKEGDNDWEISIDELRKLLGDKATLGETIEVPIPVPSTGDISTVEAEKKRLIYTYDDASNEYKRDKQPLNINQDNPSFYIPMFSDSVPLKPGESETDPAPVVAPTTGGAGGSAPVETVEKDDKPRPKINETDETITYITPDGEEVTEPLTQRIEADGVIYYKVPDKAEYIDSTGKTLDVEKADKIKILPDEKAGSGWEIVEAGGSYTVTNGEINPAKLSLDSDHYGIKVKGRLPERIESGKITYKLIADKSAYVDGNGKILILKKGDVFKPFYDDLAAKVEAKQEAKSERLSHKQSLADLNTMARWGFDVDPESKRDFKERIEFNFKKKYKREYGDHLQIELTNTAVDNGKAEITFKVHSEDGKSKEFTLNGSAADGLSSAGEGEPLVIGDNAIMNSEENRDAVKKLFQDSMFNGIFETLVLDQTDVGAEKGEISRLAEYVKETYLDEDEEKLRDMKRAAKYAGFKNKIDAEKALDAHMDELLASDELTAEEKTKLSKIKSNEK